MAVAEEARWAQVQAGVITPDAELTVLALLDARMDEVYSAAYRWEPLPGASHGRWHEAAPLQVSAPEQLHLPDDRTVLQAGNAFTAYGDRLPRVATGGLRCEALPTAAALLRLAPALWAQGLAVPAEQAMPLYIRDKVANTTAEREAIKAQALQAQTTLAKAAAQP
jgi:tRNA threonylcarbamoyladenosine biosynthesis protein TsaB